MPVERAEGETAAVPLVGATLELEASRLDGALELDKTPVDSKRLELETAPVDSRALELGDTPVDSEGLELETAPVDSRALELGDTPVDSKALELEDTPVDSKALELDDTPVDSKALELEDTPVDSKALELDDTPVDSKALELEDTPVDSKALELDDTPVAMQPVTEGMVVVWRLKRLIVWMEIKSPVKAWPHVTLAVVAVAGAEEDAVVEFTMLGEELALVLTKELEETAVPELDAEALLATDFVGDAVPGSEVAFAEREADSLATEEITELLRAADVAAVDNGTVGPEALFPLILDETAVPGKAVALEEMEADPLGTEEIAVPLRAAVEEMREVSSPKDPIVDAVELPFDNGALPEIATGLTDPETDDNVVEVDKTGPVDPIVEAVELPFDNGALPEMAMGLTDPETDNNVLEVDKIGPVDPIVEAVELPFDNGALPEIAMGLTAPETDGNAVDRPNPVDPIVDGVELPFENGALPEMPTALTDPETDDNAVDRPSPVEPIRDVIVEFPFEYGTPVELAKVPEVRVAALVGVMPSILSIALVAVAKMRARSRHKLAASEVRLALRALLAWLRTLESSDVTVDRAPDNEAIPVVFERRPEVTDAIPVAFGRRPEVIEAIPVVFARRPEVKEAIPEVFVREATPEVAETMPEVAVTP
ncbi:trans-sialidase [Teratosphaeria destructans]|uniref:Trans-sialidase n=1 Tax=Teratosphaeria destructans TaxID=418781 RepID=A0A9W7W0K4_9PEZI|nr:trans-sialidase [Teratosphaeria destructans]